MSDTEESSFGIDLDDLGFALLDLVDEHGLPLVIEILSQVCWYKGNFIQDGTSSNTEEIKAFKYWRKNTERLKKIHHEILDDVECNAYPDDPNGKRN